MEKSAKLIPIVVILILVSFMILSVNAQGKFCGSKNSDVYHYPSCSYAERISISNLIWFADYPDALALGYRPCEVCKPPSFTVGVTPTIIIDGNSDSYMIEIIGVIVSIAAIVPSFIKLRKWRSNRRKQSKSGLKKK